MTDSAPSLSPLIHLVDDDAAVREGIRASALCVTQPGAQPSIPTRAAVAQSPLPPDWSPL